MSVSSHAFERAWPAAVGDSRAPNAPASLMPETESFLNWPCWQAILSFFLPLARGRYVPAFPVMKPHHSFVLAACLILTTTNPARSQVLVSEIMYHPVEHASFDTNGQPVLDLSADLHEFIELHNTNTVNVALAGWRLSGGIDFEFPAGAIVIEMSPIKMSGHGEVRFA